MNRRALPLTALAVFASLPAVAQEAVHVAPHTTPHVAPHADPHVSPHLAPHAHSARGPAWIVPQGDHAGKHLRVWVDSHLAGQGGFTVLPPGAIGPLPVEAGLARTVRVRIEIEGCPGAWERDVAVAPLRNTSLIFAGCQVTPLWPQ